MTNTPELKRYACSETGGGEIIEWPNGEYVRFADVEAYTQAAIAAVMMGAVKPLGWGGYYGRSAANPWGGYHITDREGPNQDYDWFGWTQLSRGGFDESDEDYPTIEAAKAAAQADYNTRILSALSIPTDATTAIRAIKGGDA
jgi:hypothetical protein